MVPARQLGACRQGVQGLREWVAGGQGVSSKCTVIVHFKGEQDLVMPKVHEGFMVQRPSYAEAVPAQTVLSGAAVGSQVAYSASAKAPPLRQSTCDALHCMGPENQHCAFTASKRPADHRNTLASHTLAAQHSQGSG